MKRFELFTEYLMGDAMTLLNMIHNYCNTNNDTALAIFHWPNNESWLYHYEDPETASERIDYIHQFYKDSHKVNIEHIFNSPINKKLKRNHIMSDDEVYNWDFINPVQGETTLRAEWLFDRRFKLPPIENKVTIWSYKNNASKPKDWKTAVGDWDNILDLLNKFGYNVTEIDYRTPIREAMWHINTSQFLVSYDGMWHYISKNLAKPHFVTSNSWFTKIHTPHCIMMKNDKQVDRYLMDVESSHVFEKAKLYEDRQSSY